MRRSLCGFHRLCRRPFSSIDTSTAATPDTRNVASISARKPKIPPLRKIRGRSALPTTSSTSKLLSEARSFGIESIAELKAESGQALADRPLLAEDSYRQNPFFLRLLLDFAIPKLPADDNTRLLVHQFRRHAVRLDSDDEVTNAIWRKLLLAILSSPNDIPLLRLTCERHGIVWARSKLFAEVVGTLIQVGKNDFALKMARYLQKDLDDESQLMLDLYDFYQPQGNLALGEYFLVYAELGYPVMRSSLVPRMLENGKMEDALFTHWHLLRQGDGPSIFADIQAFLIYFAETDQSPETFLAQMRAAGYRFESQGRRLYDDHRQRTLGPDCQLFSEGSAAPLKESKNVSDGFAAKAFATRGLPFEFLMNSLQAFGLVEIGPQTLRTIGVAAKDLDTLRDRLKMLSDSGIDTGGSAYARVVHRLCDQRSHFMLTQVLHTDMHHDVFEDRELQQRLLTNNLQKSNWPEVNLLLTIMNQGNLHQLRPIAANSFLQAFMHGETQWRAYAHALTQLATQSTVETQFRIVNKMIEGMRTDRVRRVSRSERRKKAEQVAALMQHACIVGCHFEPFHWRHLLSRLGSTGTVGQVLDLLAWLVQHTSKFGNEKMIRGKPNHGWFWKTLLTPQFQASLVNWTLNNTLSHTEAEIFLSMRRTLKALKQMEDDSLTTIDLNTVRGTIVSRCRNALYRRQHPTNAEQQSATRQPKQAWALCFRLLEVMNHLWRESEASRTREFQISSRKLRKRQRRSHRPSLWFFRKRAQLETAQ